MRQFDSTASLILWVVILTSARHVKCSSLKGNVGLIKRNTCDSSQLYRDLMALGDSHNCIGDNQVWSMLDRLYHETNGPNCMKEAIVHLNGKFVHTVDTPEYCSCSGSLSSNHMYPHVSDFGEHVHDCYNDDSFRHLYDLYFGHHMQRRQHCRSHHGVWHGLASIGSDLCRNEIVRHVSVVTSGDQCSCTTNAPGTTVQQIDHATHPAANSDICFQFSSYNYLYDLSLHVDKCVSVNSMWHYLADLQHKNVDCRRKIMDHMNGVFHGQINSVNCHCTGHDTHHSIIRLPNLDQDYCNKVHQSYRVVHNEIYAHSPSPCRSHQYVWQKLLNIPILHGERDCRADLILHAAATYPDSRHDPCSCSQVIVPATSESTSVPSATSPSATQERTDTLNGLHTCNKALTISEIAHNFTVTHANASDCIPGDHRSSEALVFVSCNTHSTETWKKGENVMTLCNRIPLFTPIATFTPDGVYTSIGGTAGIFLGCITNGFKIAVQNCHASIQINHLLTGGILANDPANYFIVRW